MANPPGALTADRPNCLEMIEAGEFSIGYRKQFSLTQSEAARVLGVKYRRLQLYEATVRWSALAKERIRTAPGCFDFTATKRLAERQWKNQRSLVAEIERIIIGKPQRKRYTRSVSNSAAHDDLRSQEALRNRFGTKVLITEDSIVLQHFGNAEIKEMLLEKLIGQSFSETT